MSDQNPGDLTPSGRMLVFPTLLSVRWEDRVQLARGPQTALAVVTPKSHVTALGPVELNTP